MRKWLLCQADQRRGPKALQNNRFGVIYMSGLGCKSGRNLHRSAHNVNRILSPLKPGEKVTYQGLQRNVLAIPNTLLIYTNTNIK